MLAPSRRARPLRRSSLTSQDGSYDRGQEAPGVDRHVEDGEELLPLFELGAKKKKFKKKTCGFISERRQWRSEPTYAVFVKLVSSERRNAGFDSSGPQSDEDEPSHGQTAATHQKHPQRFSLVSISSR